jgi:hypothetical protein
VAAAALAQPAPAPAQGPARSAAPFVVAGRLVRVRGTDTTGLAGFKVVVHRVATTVQGPVDSTASGRGGRFAFRVTRPDTGAMYVVSALYDGIGYFSGPVSTQARDSAKAIVLAVFDTASAGAPLVVSVRHVVISAPDPADGSRDVLDIAEVGNPGSMTLVPRTAGGTTWWMRLPRGVESFRVGEGDVPSSAVRQAGDSVLVGAPFPPGEKQVVVTYVAPKDLGTLRVPLDQPTERLELLVEDSLATATGPGLVTANPLVIQGRSFRRFSAAHLDPGQTVSITFRARGTGRRFEWVAIVLAALVLAAGGFAAARRRAPGGTVPPGGSVPAGATVAPGAPVRDDDALVRQIVALDEKYAAGEAATPPGEWAAYQAKRAALKAELAGRLARR